MEIKRIACPISRCSTAPTSQAEQIAYCWILPVSPILSAAGKIFFEDDQVHLCSPFFRTLIDKEDAISRLICNKALGEVRLQNCKTNSSPNKKRKGCRADRLGLTATFWAKIRLWKNCCILLFLPQNKRSADHRSIWQRSRYRTQRQGICPEAVSLMTLHGAKGLNIRSFCAGASRKAFPFHIQGLTADEDEEKAAFLRWHDQAKDGIDLS